jgi:periplasmic protein TonB
MKSATGQFRAILEPETVPARRRPGGGSVRDRLTTMLVLVALAHAILILGISFGTEPASDAPRGLEVLLTSDELPEAARNDKAHYLAQRTQHGSGNTRDQATGSPTPQAPALASEGDSEGNADREQTQAGSGASTLLTTGNALRASYLGTDGADGDSRRLSKRSSPALPLMLGRGDADELVVRGDQVTGQWLAPDTQASDLAPYMDAWRRRVERLGTLNFPSVASRAKLSGSPEIEAVLRADGRLMSATVRRSSGYAELDQAALGILRLASPFDPFPPEIAGHYRTLRILYQWEFLAGSVGHGSVTAATNPGGNP